MTSNRIVSVHLDLMENQHWQIVVHKVFAPEHGGGSQLFQGTANTVHRALDIAREMVTVSPAQRRMPA